MKSTSPVLKKFFENAEGSVMMESIIMLPVVLLALMAAVQFAHIFFARQITDYAAFSAARSGRFALSESVAQENALKSAKQICSIISLSAPQGASGVLFALPWLGEVAGSQALDSKLAVNCSPANTPAGAFAAEVTMNFPLVVPLVNTFLSGVLKFREKVNPVFSTSSVGFGRFHEGTPHGFIRTFDQDVFPHITITRRALVPANPTLAD